MSRTTCLKHKQKKQGCVKIMPKTSRDRDESVEIFREAVSNGWQLQEKLKLCIHNIKIE